MPLRQHLRLLQKPLGEETNGIVFLDRPASNGIHNMHDGQTSLVHAFEGRGMIFQHPANQVVENGQPALGELMRRERRAANDLKNSFEASARDRERRWRLADVAPKRLPQDFDKYVHAKEWL
jgi:hypothetical protein